MPVVGLGVEDLRRLRNEAFQRADFYTALSWSKLLEDRLVAETSPTAPLTLKEMAQTASIYVWLHDFQTALSTYNVVLRAQTATLGANHPDTLLTKAEIKEVLACQRNCSG